MKFTQKLLITLLLFAVAQKSMAQNNKPNIILIFSDDHAYQAISAYGGKLATTPNIDRIAKEGALFKNSFVTNSICGPSRATLLTGKYSHVNGYKVNERKFDNNQLIFPEILQQNGYQTAWIGKMHLGVLPKGFNDFNILPGQGNYYNPDFINLNNDTIRHEGYVTNIITGLSTEWLTNRDTTKPFFLVVGEKATHREWLPDLQDLGAYDNQSFALPPTFYDDYKGRAAAAGQDMTIDKTMRLPEDLKVHLDYKKAADYKRMTPAQAKIFDAYYDNVVTKDFDEKKLSGNALTEWKYQRYLKDYLSVAKGLDRNIGAILSYLDKSGLAKNTVVIYASDQGFYMGEHGWFDKRFMYEESVRTPFVMRYPGVIKPGTVVSSFISNIDWAPSILNIAGAPVPKEMQGVSFLPLFTNKNIAKTWNNELYYHYYEYPEPHHVYPHFGIRTQQYKLVYFYGESKSWELFDLYKDPHEINNIYSNKSNTKTMLLLKEKLKTLITKYKDDEALKLLDEAKQ